MKIDLSHEKYQKIHEKHEKTWKKHEKMHKIYTKVKNVKKMKNPLPISSTSENHVSKLKKTWKTAKIVKMALFTD